MADGILLSDRGLIEITGADATEFLHNLVTNDIRSLAKGETRFAALLTPQGKIISDFLVFREQGAAGDRLLLDCPLSLTDELLRRFERYRLRSKVAFADLSAAHEVVAYLDSAPPEEGVVAAAPDPRSPELGWRAIMRKGAAGARGDRAIYEARRIAAGIPDGHVDFDYGGVFPHEANMDRLSGLDFKKGCYVGQEVVSRMQHRTTVRKRVSRFTSRSEAPAQGSPVFIGGVDIGVTGSRAGADGLALIRIDRLAELLDAGHTAEAAGVALDFDSQS
ncbi:YgfZ/GcvT domain-containing protein [Methylocystis sp.]|uniref:CAF17-like 4Fe-4S cluster assembly/insertion protein YgfZ n=1 Tax=Methylocystis sp. TaxID=1911079 RepID=UPI003D132E03